MILFFIKKKSRENPKIYKILGSLMTFKKSFKHKQHLYNKLIKNISEKNETEHKNHKNLFEIIKKYSTTFITTNY